LERSTFASLQTVEVVAMEELQMKFPLEVEGVVQ
jgi:cell division protein FtsL